MDLSNKHLKKIRSGSPGSSRNREKEIYEILTADFFSEGFPKTLNLDDQGRFAVGYYQQKFYVKEIEDKGEEA
jgi:CRISPR-associated protein Csd1